jgi:23S rRNA A1618 N6-methylase RlmF
MKIRQLPYTHKDYWIDCITDALYECDASLRPDQISYVAEAVQNNHENYGMAFYTPPSSDRVYDIEKQHEEKYKKLQKEFDEYRNNAESALKKALKQKKDSNISINENGDVFSYEGRT